MISPPRPAEPLATSAHVRDTSLVVALVDGRTLIVPLGWFPRLKHASMADLRDVRLTGQGRGLRWDALDEDLSVRGLLYPAVA